MASDMSNVDFSKIFHQSSKNHSKGHSPIPKNTSDWPDEWKRITYKVYPRLPKIPLADEPPQSELFRVIRNRSSKRSYTDGSVTKRDIAILLKNSCGLRGKEGTGRAQPSGGSRFPIEMYVLIIQPIEDIKPGIYHYDVVQNCLETLLQKDLAGDIKDLFTYDWLEGASAVFLLTAHFARNQIKYGERGYRYVLIEAGHIGQNLALISEYLGLCCCSMGGTRDEKLEELIEIDGFTESLVYAVAVGK